MRQIKSLLTTPKRWRHEGAEQMWALSILRTIKFYGSVEIFTDELGQMWLEAMQLPVAGRMQISLLLEDLRSIDPHNWAIGKIYTNMNQSTPFIQTDGDVIIGRCFPRRMHEASVCTEKLYGKCPGPWFGKLSNLPQNWRDDWKDGNTISFNCGTFGGNDIPAIKKATTTAFDYAVINLPQCFKVDSPDVATAFEEWSIAREIDPLEVTCLHSMDPAGSEMLKRAKAYWHMPGAVKIEERVQEIIRQRLELECPGQLRRCIDVANSFSRSRM